MFKRKATYPISDVFTNRWSPRAMSGESIDNEQLLALFEAARWAPSSYNGQPWRFVYVHRDSSSWEKLFNLLAPFNQSWAKNASALVFIISKKTFEFNSEPSRTHSFDTGAAWMSLALQASIDGLAVRGIELFDYDKARILLNIPDAFDIEIMCAIGKPGKVEDLPEDLRAKEGPSDRIPLSEIVFEGVFGKDE